MREAWSTVAFYSGSLQRLLSQLGWASPNAWPDLLIVRGLDVRPPSTFGEASRKGASPFFCEASNAQISWFVRSRSPVCEGTNGRLDEGSCLHRASRSG